MFLRLLYVNNLWMLGKYYHFVIELLEDEVLAIQTRILEAACWSFFTTDFSCTYGQRQAVKFLNQITRLKFKSLKSSTLITLRSAEAGWISSNPWANFFHTLKYWRIKYLLGRRSTYNMHIWMDLDLEYIKIHIYISFSCHCWSYFPIFKVGTV